MKQNILIIGRNGFLATNLFKYFKSKKISVVKNSFNFFLKNQEKKLLKYNYVINCSINSSFLNKKYDSKYDQDLLCAEKLKDVNLVLLETEMVVVENVKMVRFVLSRKYHIRIDHKDHLVVRVVEMEAMVEMDHMVLTDQLEILN